MSSENPIEEADPLEAGDSDYDYEEPPARTSPFSPLERLEVGSRRVRRTVHKRRRVGSLDGIAQSMDPKVPHQGDMLPPPENANLDSTYAFTFEAPSQDSHYPNYSAMKSTFPTVAPPRKNLWPAFSESLRDYYPIDINAPMEADSDHEEEPEVIPKIEPDLEDERSKVLAVPRYKRNGEIGPSTFKRPRGRPRKHPIAPPSETKTAKGRSKTGCLTCRKRKKKCDEAKPGCLNCAKNSVVCEGYPEPTYWKSGKAKLEEGTPSPNGFQDEQRVQRHTLPHHQLPSMLPGVDTAEDRVFLRHYVFRLSSVITVEGKETNAFKTLLLPTALQNVNLMHSILSLAGRNIDFESEWGMSLLAEHPEVSVEQLKERSQYHHDQAVRSFFSDNYANKDINSLAIRYSQMMCSVIGTLSDGTTNGEHRLHLNAYRNLIEEVSHDSHLQHQKNPLINFIEEFFQYHIVFDGLVSPPRMGTPSPNEFSGPHKPPQLCKRPVNQVFGVQDRIYFSLMDRIGRLRETIRFRRRTCQEPFVDCDAIYHATTLDANIRAWIAPDEGAEKGLGNVTSRLYKQMIWVYLWRTIYTFEPRITGAVDDALKLFELIPRDDVAQTALLSPAFVIGCAAFQANQQARIREVVRKIRTYTGMKNADVALQVLEEVWRKMNSGQDSWDWQHIAHSMGIDFLAT